MSVIHLSDKPAVTITAYHEEFFKLADGAEKAIATMSKKADALFRSKYCNPNPTFPTYAQWENDIAALQAIAERVKRNPKYVLSVYRATCEAVFGALPVSLDSDAMRVRDSRMSDAQKLAHDKAKADAVAEGKEPAHAAAIAVKAAKKAKSQKVQEQPGAPAGTPKDQKVSEAEMMEQFIARFGSQGVFVALDAVVRILASEKVTEDKAKALNSIRNNLAKQLKVHEAAKAA